MHSFLKLSLLWYWLTHAAGRWGVAVSLTITLAHYLCSNAVVNPTPLSHLPSRRDFVIERVLFKGNQREHFFWFPFPFILFLKHVPPQCPQSLLRWVQKVPRAANRSPPVKNVCKRPAATQRDATDGRVTVPSPDGLPRWSGISELEAELWKWFLAHFTFSRWQVHTLLSCEFWRLERPDARFDFS